MAGGPRNASRSTRSRVARPAGTARPGRPPVDVVEADRVSSANAIVSSAKWTPEMRKRKASKPMIAATAAHRDREPDARPGTDAVMNEQPRRRVGAEADVERVPERELTGEAHHDVPGLADVREVEHQRRDREHVVARDERQREQHDPSRRDRRRHRRRSACHLRRPHRPCGRHSSTRISRPKLTMLLAEGVMSTPASASETADEHAAQRARRPSSRARPRSRSRTRARCRTGRAWG